MGWREGHWGINLNGTRIKSGTQIAPAVWTMGLFNAAALVLIAAIPTCTALAPLFGPAGVPNFHRVNDTLYRGGQPTIAGLQALSKLGIKTVMDLRMPRRISDWEEREVKRFRCEVLKELTQAQCKSV